MLTGLTIGNFKAFGDPPQHIPIRPLTLIFGPNSSGKSSILHSLLLVNHALETGNWDVHHPRGAGSAVDLGGFPHYLHTQYTERPMSVAVESRLGLGKTLRKELLGSDEELTAFEGVTKFRWTYQVEQERVTDDPSEHPVLPTLQTATLDLNDQPALVFRRKEPALFQCQEICSENAYLRSVLESVLKLSAQRSEKANKHEEAERVRSGLPILQRRLGEVMRKRNFLLGRMPSPNHEYVCLTELGYDPLPACSDFTLEQFQSIDGTLLGLCLDWFSDVQNPISFGDEPTEELTLEAEAEAVRINLALMLRHLSFVAGYILKRIVYLGPLRQVPRRHPGGDWQFALEKLGSGLQEWATVCNIPEVRDTINRWLGKGWLATHYRVGVQEWVIKDDPGIQPLREPIFYVGNSAAQLSVHDLGFGIGQVLPVLARAAASRKSVTCVEQPELHLHPAMQAELGDVFIESALGERQNTFLLETHSEHLILRILRRVRETTEGKLPEGKTPVRPEDVSVVYVQPGPNGAEVIELPVTPDGDFSRPWPGGFFAERFQELP